MLFFFYLINYHLQGDLALAPFQPLLLPNYRAVWRLVETFLTDYFDPVWDAWGLSLQVQNRRPVWPVLATNFREDINMCFFSRSTWSGIRDARSQYAGYIIPQILNTNSREALDQIYWLARRSDLFFTEQGRDGKD